MKKIRPPVRLKKWRTVYIKEEVTPYMAPETIPIRLSGEAYGHYRFEDGHVITTSSVVELDLDRRVARTRSGSTYILEDPEPEFVEWMRKTGQQTSFNKLFPN